MEAEKKIIEHGIRVLANDYASGDPLPGPLPNIFDGEPIDVHGIKIRKMFVVDEIIFKKLNSPVLKIMQEQAKPENMREPLNFDAEDIWMLVAQFTMTPQQAYNLLGKGVEAFKQYAVQEISCKMSMPQLDELVKAIMQQLVGANATRVSHESEEASNGNGLPFPKPTSVEEPLTVSAGGLT